MAAPVYLYTGPEAGERNDQVIAIKESLKKKYGSSDDFTYYGNDLNMSDVVTQLMTESLFTPATSVVIRNAEAVKDKKDIDMLSEWVKSAENKDTGTIMERIKRKDDLIWESKKHCIRKSKTNFRY